MGLSLGARRVRRWLRWVVKRCLLPFALLQHRRRIVLLSLASLSPSSNAGLYNPVPCPRFLRYLTDLTDNPSSTSPPNYSLIIMPKFNPRGTKKSERCYGRGCFNEPRNHVPNIQIFTLEILFLHSSIKNNFIRFIQTLFISLMHLPLHQYHHRQRRRICFSNSTCHTTHSALASKQQPSRRKGKLTMYCGYPQQSHSTPNASTKPSQGPHYPSPQTPPPPAPSPHHPPPPLPPRAAPWRGSQT